MKLSKRRKTPTVQIGSVLIGSDHPVVVQSMTNTPTADVEASVEQIIELIEAGAEMVRLTINDDNAAKAVPIIFKSIQNKGYNTPIIGDFHYNGHTLLQNNPECAQLLSKYRINPGNIGKGSRHDENFATIIKIAIANDKAIRIGINYGSLDQELLTSLMDQNAKIKNPLETKEIIYEAMVQSALQSAEYTEKLGLSKNKIILSVKMSILQDMVNAYSLLAKRCAYPLHLGLTEAGGDVQGITASSAALSILLQQGIGDTIRVSLTPQPDVKRTREVEVCKSILQSLGLRYFSPTVTSCPGCGRTGSTIFQTLAQDVTTYIKTNMPLWKNRYDGVERLKIAVMGCIVNGPGESKHADIGISLPGASETPMAPVYTDGKKLTTLKGDNIKEEFFKILEEYISRTCTVKNSSCNQ